MENKFGHIMVDLETMSTNPGAAILSIGAVEFNMVTGDTGKEFYCNVDLQSCIDIGLDIEAKTIMWWLKQSYEAREKLATTKGDLLQKALVDFGKFVEECGGQEVEIWGNGPTFDLTNLAIAYQKTSLAKPWNFSKERCVRTLVSQSPYIKSVTKFQGVLHDALADCHHQIKYCSATYRKIHRLDD